MRRALSCFPYILRENFRSKNVLDSYHLDNSNSVHTKRKGKQTKPNKRRSNKRTESTKISSLFPKRGNRNAKRTEKHNNTR